MTSEILNHPYVISNSTRDSHSPQGPLLFPSPPPLLLPRGPLQPQGARSQQTRLLMALATEVVDTA